MDDGCDADGAGGVAGAGDDAGVAGAAGDVDVDGLDDVNYWALRSYPSECWFDLHLHHLRLYHGDYRSFD